MPKQNILSNKTDGNLQQMSATCKLLAFLLASCFCVMNAVNAEVTLEKETEMTDYALHYAGLDGGSVISPHGDCFTVVNGYIFAVWYAGPQTDSRLHISRKKLGEDHWVDMTINEAKNNRVDSHRTAAVGVSPIDGTVHVAFDHHAIALRYIYSVKGAAFVPDSQWTPALMYPEQRDLSGTDVPQVTYPQFWNNDEGELMFAYREHGATAGEVKVANYDGNRWSVPKTMLDGYHVASKNYFYAYNDFYNYFGKTYFLATVQIPEGSETRKKGLYFASISGNTGTGDFTTRSGEVVGSPIETRNDVYKLRIVDPQITYGISAQYLVVTSDGTAYASHNGKVLRSNPGETTFSYIKDTAGTLLGVGDKVFAFNVSSGVDKLSRYNPETDNWDRVYTGESGRGINRYFVARAYKNKIIAVIQRNGDGGQARPINCIEIDTGEPDPTSTTAPTYGNVGSGDPWAIIQTSTTRIEAENYDLGGAGIAYSDTDEGNNGGQYRSDDVDIGENTDGASGYAVGWTRTGEWLQYTTDVEKPGLYEVSIRYAHPGTESSGLKISMNGADVSGTINAAGTGSWGIFSTVTATLELQSGVQAMRLHFIDGSINVNWLEFTAVAAPQITYVQPSGYAYWDEAAAWSDGQAAHSGADYIVPFGDVRSPNGSSVFPGYALIVEAGAKFQVSSRESSDETTRVDYLSLSGGTGYISGQFAELSAGSGSSTANVLDGTLVNSGYSRLLTFDEASGNPLNRSLKILSKIKGDGHLQAWEGQGGNGGDTVTITNEANTFSGTWETGAGSKLLFTNAGAVGAGASIEVLATGKLEIQGDWSTSGSLSIADAANTEVDFSNHIWSVSNLNFSGSALPDGVYSAAQLNALSSDTVFNGLGAIRVGTLSKGPVAHWTFDEGSGFVASDSSGNGYNGTIKGASWATGTGNRAAYLSFDGSNDRVETLFQSDFTSLAKDFTWAVWVNNQAAPNNGVILGNRYPTINSKLNFSKLTTSKVDSVLGGSGQDIDFDDITQNGWHHHAVVKSGSTLLYYRDGAFVDSREITTYADGTFAFNIGGDPAGSAAEHFQGYIDDVVLYNRALTAYELSNVMNEIYVTVISAVDLGGLVNWQDGSTWSDGLAPHAGFDYIIPATGNVRSETTTATFAGDSLTVLSGGKFQVQPYESEGEVTIVDNLIFSGGKSFAAGQFAELSAGRGSSETNVLDGTLTNSGYTRILTFDKIGSGPLNRSLKILSQIKGDGHLQAWEGSSGNGGATLTITNAANTFSGTWETGAGSTLVFTNAGAVGTADIEVMTTGKLSIHSDWTTSGTLNVADAADTRVDVGNYIWNVSALTFGGIVIADGAYAVAELNALGTHPVFAGSGGVRVGAGGQIGPVARWKFNEGSGSIANDSSGAGYHGSISGASWRSDATRSSHLSFDGNNDQVETLFQVNPTSSIKNFTWSAWVNNQAPADNGVILGNRYPQINGELNFLKLTSSKVDTVLGGTDQSIDFADMAQNGWHHHTVVKSGSSLLYYRDGVLLGNKEITTLADGSYPFFIGGDAIGNANEHFKGYIDDVVIHDRALNPSEITDVMSIPDTSRKEDWRMLHFGTTGNSGSAADDFDADFDGESNMLEFATNQDPHASTPATTSVEMDGTKIKFRYTRSKAAMAEGMSFQVKWSDTLEAGSWSGSGVTESMESETAEEQHIVAEIPMGTSGARFMHLEITP